MRYGAESWKNRPLHASTRTRSTTPFWGCFLNAFRERWDVRAWKSLDWDALDRLHQQGLISDPRSKVKSVVLTKDGEQRTREAAERLFGSAGT